MKSPTSAPTRSVWARPPVSAPWRFALARGRGDVADLRRWAWWSWWASYPRKRSKLRAARDLVIAPWRFARAARENLSYSGAKVAEQYGVSFGRQRWHLLWLWLRHGMLPRSYYRFQLFRPERLARAALFVDYRQSEVLLRVMLNRLPAADNRIFMDKRFFASWCVEHGLPTVGVLMEFHGGRVARSTIAELPPSDLFSKPADWQSGRGIHRWHHRGEARWQADGADRARTADELVADLAAMSVELRRPIVLQRLLRNHPALAPLTSGALCTVRLLTYRPPGASPHTLLGVYRMAVGDTPADNFHLGGLAAPVDLGTGKLSAAVRNVGHYPVDIIERHPDTGAVIVGWQMPCWPDVLRLVERASEHVSPRIPFVGWDVAILDEGPVLLEANNVVCSMITQMPCGEPLGATPFPQCLTAHLREVFAL